MPRSLQRNDVVRYKLRPGLGVPKRLGQVLELEPHHALVQPMRQEQGAVVPQGQPVRLPLSQVRALQQRAVAVIRITSASPGRTAARRSSRPAEAEAPYQPPLAAATVLAAELPQLAPVLVCRTGPVPLRALPKPLPPSRSRAYLDFVRGHQCCSCAAQAKGPDPLLLLLEEEDLLGLEVAVDDADSAAGARSDPHHHGPRGMGQRTDDLRTVPLCRKCHDHYHDTGRLPGRDQAETVVFILRVQVQLLVQFYGHPEAGR